MFGIDVPIAEVSSFVSLVLMDRFLTTLTIHLSRKPANEEWVEFSHDGDCSFAGVYQPPLPPKQSSVFEFIATSNYADIFAFLQLGKRASLSELNEAAKHVCLLDWQALQKYNKKLPEPISDDYELTQFCFRSVFAYQILRNGYGFSEDFNFTAVDVLNGQKLGWALGSMLYEINTRKFGDEGIDVASVLLT
jgi:hypothetical protein